MTDRPAIKPLEWKEDWGGSLDDIPEWRAKTPWGSITVSVAGYRDTSGNSYERHSDVPEELKATLISEREADFASSIRSCLLDKPEAVEGVPDDIALKAEYLSLNILNVNNHEYAKEAIIHALMRERMAALSTPADTDAAQSELDRLRRELEEARRALEVASDEILSMYRTWVADDYEAMPPKNSLPGKAYYSARAALKEPTP
ncbi:hypothetical protein GOB40_13660 [Sinorhizobium meliloti]|nr:hypothetical protein [Sinorhizobium meliloti]